MDTDNGTPHINSKKRNQTYFTKYHDPIKTAHFFTQLLSGAIEQLIM